MLPSPYYFIMESNIVAELKNVSIGYEGKSIIEGISMRITRGDLIGFVGPNGGGKTTLVKTLLGLIPPVRGSLAYTDGITFGYVPQNSSFDSIFPLSVQEVIRMGTYARVPFTRSPAAEDMQKVHEAADRLGIKHLIDRPFRSLSGGEKQRALIARAIVSEPDLMVLDEPTASVDLKGESEIMSLISEMKTSKQFTIIIVSHYIASLVHHAEKITMIDKDRNFFLFEDKAVALGNPVLRSFSGPSV